MTSVRAAKDGYELAGQSTDRVQSGSREQSPHGVGPPRRLDEGLSDDEDDEIEQLLSTGHGRLSVGNDRTDDGKDEGPGGDSSEEPGAELQASSATGSEEKSVLTRVTGGMTARQRRVFTAEMLGEVCPSPAASNGDFQTRLTGECQPQTLPVLLLTLFTSILTGELLHRVQVSHVVPIISLSN